MKKNLLNRQTLKISFDSFERNLNFKDFKKHIPLRTCLVCGAKKEKKALIRFVAQEDGSLKKDEKQKAAGRGFYVCKEPACLEHLGNSKKFAKYIKNRVLKKQ